jgi:hypothetical protein
MGTAQRKGWRALKSVYARDITVALIVKLALLTALFALFSSAAFRPASDAAATAAAVAGVARDGGLHP